MSLHKLMSAICEKDLSACCLALKNEQSVTVCAEKMVDHSIGKMVRKTIIKSKLVVNAI